MPTYTGTSGNDTITGSATADTIDGLAGDDSLYGDGGDDVINGGAGADYIDGGTGADTMSGGTENDTYVVDSVFDSVVENPAEGNHDLVIASVNYTLSANVEDLTLSGSAVSGSGNALGNIITGNSGDNSLFGDDGADTLYGLGGNDTLYGGSSNHNDLLDGGAGDDVMYGGLGNDGYYVDSASDAVIENASEGSDYVRNSVTYTLTNNVESMQMQGSSNIDGTGNGLANAMTGNSGDNVLYGMAGGDDLVGGSGADTLIGGTGRDDFTGGLGADLFVVLQESITTPVEFDFFKDTDFSQGDRIDLSAIDADSTTGGDQAFTLNTTGLTGVAGQGYMFYSAGDNATICRFDVNGDGSADYVIEITGASLFSTHVSTGPTDGGWIL